MSFVHCDSEDYALFMTVVTGKSEQELKLGILAVDNAVAQQELEGLTVSAETVEDMRRAARGEISDDEVIANIYARFGLVPCQK
jgi:hypothetical protein